MDHSRASDTARLLENRPLGPLDNVDRPENELGFLGLISERHRPDHDARHADPFAPEHAFIARPPRSHPDIA